MRTLSGDGAAQGPRRRRADEVAIARLARRLGATKTVLTVQHDLPLALHADRVWVLREGRIVADGAPADPALQQALVRAFDGAVRIDHHGGQPVALPALD